MTLPELIEAEAQALQAAQDAGALGFGHGTLNAWDEAAWLVLWRLGLPLDTDVTDAPGCEAAPLLTAAQVRAVQALVARRIRTRTPAAYLTGQAWLQGVPFYVDARVIVPRSFIAELLVGGAGEADDADDVDKANGLDMWLPQPPARVLDMCTGSGCLAILAARHWADARVDASDISPDALAVAQINVAQHGLQNRVRLLQADGWAGLTDWAALPGKTGKTAKTEPSGGEHSAGGSGGSGGGRGGESSDAKNHSAGNQNTSPRNAAPPALYDLIVCNPPYVNARSMAALPAEYRAEPALALDGNKNGGTDGMDFVRPLLQHAAAHMAEQAVLVLEIGNERTNFEAAFPTLKTQAIWLEVSAGCDQVLLLTREALLGGS